MQALLKNDEGASTKFYEKIRPTLTRAAVHFLGYQDPDIEDVVQDTLAVAFKKMSQYEPQRSSLSNWITHICVKICFQRLRKRQRYLLSQSDELETLLQKKSKSLHDQVRVKADFDARLELLQTKLREIEGICSVILRLRHVEGESYAAIASALSIPMGTVMSRLARCREQLKQRILGRSDA